MSRSLTIFFCFLLVTQACATVAQSDARTDAAQTYLNAVLEEDGGPGVMAAVIKNGELVWSGEAGMADLEQSIPMSANQRLRIGSVSKPITAVLTLIAAQRDEVMLDTDIREYVPEFGEKIGIVTLRRLGSHTAGVRHYDFSNYLEANNVFHRATLTEGIESFAADPLVAPPGEAFEYTSLGYNLIGAAIERGTGESFSDALRKRLAEPFALENTTTDNPMEIIKNRAGFYTVTVKNPVMTWMEDGKVINTIMRDSSDYYPSGGMLSTAQDLARFAFEAFNSSILTEESHDLLITPATLHNGEIAQLDNGAEKVGYAFGWQIRGAKDGLPRSYGHDGETNGAYALVRYYPEHDVAVAAIANYNIMGREPSFFQKLGSELPLLFLD